MKATETARGLDYVERVYKHPDASTRITTELVTTPVCGPTTMTVEQSPHVVGVWVTACDACDATESFRRRADAEEWADAHAATPPKGER
jgi:hypothetical protein